MNVTNAIREQALRQPEATALIRATGAPVSYRMLERQIDGVARRVLGLGVQPGQTVALGIGGPDECLALVVALGLARIGVTTAEIDLPARYLAAAFGQPGRRAPVGVRGFTIDELWLLDDGSAVPMPIQQNGAAILRVLTTSGTTGRPRFCAISHTTMAVRAVGTGAPVIAAGWPTIAICAVGLGGAWGLRTALAVLGAGGTLVFTHRARLAASVQQHGVTSLTISTANLQAVLAGLPAEAGPLPSLRGILTGGSMVPERLRQAAAARLCPNVMVCYGATEVGTMAIGHPDVLATVPFAVGTLEPDVAAQAVDAEYNPLPAGAAGLLRFRTNGAIGQYLDDAAATGETFRDGWFYPGDLGTVTAQRVLTITGRGGEVINHGGIKVSPGVIEAALLSLRGVTQAAAFGVPDADGVTQICAAIVTDGSIEAAVVTRLCQERLGAGAPTVVVPMQDLPRNPNGKVLTRVLAELVATRLSR